MTTLQKRKQAKNNLPQAVPYGTAWGKLCGDPILFSYEMSPCVLLFFRQAELFLAESNTFH